MVSASDFEIALAGAAKALSVLVSPTVVTHLDADGLTSGSIIYKTLRDLGRNPKILPIRQLDNVTIESVPKDGPFVLVDLGSGQLPLLADRKGPGVIIDHHEPNGAAPAGLVHVNALEQGFSGSREISSSGLAYLIASKLLDDPSFIPLAITGAAGDVQAQNGGLVGLNRRILEAGVAKGTVLARHGLPFFGRETRPLEVFLSYATEPYLPGLTGDTGACREFVRSLRIDPLATYSSLPPAQTAKLVNALHERAIQTGLDPFQMKKLVTEYYVFPEEREGTEMRDATEFSTLLNACGRNDEAAIAIDICLGDRGAAYARAKTLLAQHRENLRRSLNELLEKGARPVGRRVQLFYSPSTKPTIIGIVIGMALGGRLVDTSRVILGVSPQEPAGTLKISARASPELVRRGLNLSILMRKAAAEVGGIGGGHNVAAGASIPEDRLEEFALKLDSLISDQMSQN